MSTYSPSHDTRLVRPETVQPKTDQDQTALADGTKDLQRKLARAQAYNELYRERIIQLYQQQGQTAHVIEYLPAFSVLAKTDENYVNIWDNHPSITERRDGLATLRKATARLGDRGESLSTRKYALSAILPFADLKKPWSEQDDSTMETG